MKSTESYIPYGDPGIEETLRVMERLATDATANPELIAWVHDVIRWVPARDTDAEASAILNAVRGSFRYTHDPVAKEMIKTPHVLLQEIKQKGKAVDDCDGYVTFLLAALEIVGIEAQPLVVSETGGDYGHVLVRYMSPKRGWVTLDAITRNPPGWFPNHVKRIGVFAGGGVQPIGFGDVQGGVPNSHRGHRLAPPVTARAPLPVQRPMWPALSGCDCDTSRPTNVVAKISGKLDPYMSLFWILLGAPALFALLRRRRA